MQERLRNCFPQEQNEDVLREMLTVLRKLDKELQHNYVTCFRILPMEALSSFVLFLRFVVPSRSLEEASKNTLQKRSL